MKQPLRTRVAARLIDAALLLMPKPMRTNMRDSLRGTMVADISTPSPLPLARRTSKEYAAGAAAGWTRGVDEQWRHRPVGQRLPKGANPFVQS